MLSRPPRQMPPSPKGPEAAGRLLLVTREVSRSRFNATTSAGYSPAAEGKAALLRSTEGNAALLRRKRSAVSGLVRFGKAPHVERGSTDRRGTVVPDSNALAARPLLASSSASSRLVVAPAQGAVPGTGRVVLESCASTRAGLLSFVSSRLLDQQRLCCGDLPMRKCVCV